MTVLKKLQFAVELLKEATSQQEYLEVVENNEVDKAFVETINHLDELILKYQMLKSLK